MLLRHRLILIALIEKPDYNKIRQTENPNAIKLSNIGTKIKVSDSLDLKKGGSFFLLVKYLILMVLTALYINPYKAVWHFDNTCLAHTHIFTELLVNGPTYKLQKTIVNGSGI